MRPTVFDEAQYTGSVALVSHGGGTNSTAMLIGMVESRLPPPRAVLFADTGGEHPHTYDFIDEFSLWLELRGYPAVTVLRRARRDGRWVTLEQDCQEKATLPAIAFGWKTCSQKYKIEPQTKFANNDSACKTEWQAGRKVMKLIGYDADEFHRARFTDDPKFDLQYPLIEWGWGREECREAIARAGLTQPGKSSCFFCPHMRKPEILALREIYPDLLERALAIEDGAQDRLTKVKGLGRRFSWRGFLEADEAARREMVEAQEMPCGCYDGDDGLEDLLK